MSGSQGGLSEKSGETPVQPMFITELMLETQALCYEPSVDGFEVGVCVCVCVCLCVCA